MVQNQGEDGFAVNPGIHSQPLHQYTFQCFFLQLSYGYGQIWECLQLSSTVYWRFHMKPTKIRVYMMCFFLQYTQGDIT